uniref:Centromere protein U n=1 Tax=Catagonus wagneri TaxID=51154 RepID=A0A8C3VUS0_9CETA
IKDLAFQKHKPPDVFDFPDDSDISSISRLGENEKDEEPYETFDPPLHSTAIYADEEEFLRHGGPSLPSTPQGKEARSSDTSEIEASENESVKTSAKKPRRKPKPVSDESESTEESDVRRKVKPAENISTQQHEAVSATASSELSEKPAESVPKKIAPLSAESSVAKETLATESQLKTQRKKMCRGKRKKSRNEAIDLDTSDCVPIWCLKEKKASDIMDLDVVLSAFENVILEMGFIFFSTLFPIPGTVCKQCSNICKINLYKINLTKFQDELLRLEPELKQLQTKYDELMERKSSLKNAACFLSNLKQLHQDYSDIQEKEPNVKETYDSSSLPALLFKARPLLGTENHLQNISYQLEKLLDQK